ncbi:MAG TPA: BREX system ATP-binding domain-containing protein [Streptosporangiaceae bacterium]|nr:BREX system ATP-binding domain-containing protein [Streptosporangiaceae bacterium]
MGAVAAVPRICGREAEIAALGEALGRAAAGGSAIVLIEGEAGIGKTRLLAEALENARSRGMQVAAGRADELERTRPFGLLAATFGCVRSAPDPRRAAIASLLASQGAGDLGPITVTSDPGLRFRVVDAFADLVEELALAGPVVLGLDDLQWADPSSLLTVGVLARRLTGLPVGVIGCLRPFPRVAELDRLAGALEAAGACHLILHPLTGEAVTGLVAQVVAAEPGPRLLAEVAGAAGNPLFVTELLAALAQEGAIATAGGRAEVAETMLPPTLRLTILRRVSFLPEPTLQALRSASILGSRFTLADLATVTGRPAVDLSVVLGEAIGARVLEDDDLRLRFRHELIRDAIYQDLAGSVRRGLHREAGQRLAQAGAPALQVAEHLARGATLGDPETVTWLARAAREAAPRSPDVAADLLGRAAGLMAPGDPGRDGLLAERASSLTWAGRIADAEATCRLLLGRDLDRSVEGTVRVCLGHVLLSGGRPREGLHELERACQSPVLTGAERAGALAWASMARLRLADLDGAAATAAQARSAAVSARDHFSTSVAMSSLVLVSELRGRLGDALQIIDDAVRLADDSPGRVGHRYPVHVPRGFVLVALDRLDEARSTIETGRRISEELGIRLPLVNYYVVCAFERFIAGRWDDAIDEIEAAAALASETGQGYSFNLGHGMLSLIMLHRNDLRAARDAAGAGAGQPSGTDSRQRSNWSAWAQALLLEADGEPAQALATLGDCWDRCARSGLALEYPVIGPDLVRLALAAGEAGRARDVVAAVTGVASRNEAAWITGAALRCQGLAANDAGILQAAVSACARGSRPLELALTCEDAGAAFARQGNADRAGQLLDQAITIYERLGAARDLARAEAALRQMGVRRGRHVTHSRAQSGWQSLTPSERAVVDLVAEGLSNPQIGQRLYVSRRTVQTHLGHVFAKLHIASRAQLAAEASRHRG